MTAISKQTAMPRVVLRMYSTPTAHKSTDSRRASSTTGILASSEGSGGADLCEANRRSYSHDDIDRELDTPFNSTGNSMKGYQSSDADHVVVRAYKAIVNIMNIRWSLTGLQSQASLLSTSERGDLDNPGARLLALRSRLRNEQHMALAIDRVAAVLLVNMRDDLGASYDGVREKGFRTAIVGNKMLAHQWTKSHKQVIEEIRAAITYNFAEQIISPGINLLLGSRSQDIWEKRFSRKKVEALHRRLKQTEEGRVVLNRARDLDDAVVTIKRILSIHIGYHWRCAKYALLNTTESCQMLFRKLQGQLSTRETDMRQLESTLYLTLNKSTTKGGHAAEALRDGPDVFIQAPTLTSTSSVLSDKRRSSILSDHDQPPKKRRYLIGNGSEEQNLGALDIQLDTVPTSSTSHIIDGLPLAAKPTANRGQDDQRVSPTNGVDDLLGFPSQNSPEDHHMLDLAGEDSFQPNLENAHLDGEEGVVKHQTQSVSEYQNHVDCLSYQYGEQWGITEDVTTLDDILSLSW
ncbi:hypothetical protein V8C42DRAFT_313550 [Trichoderma barbatum]